MSVRHPQANTRCPAPPRAPRLLLPRPTVDKNLVAVDIKELSQDPWDV